MHTILSGIDSLLEDTEKVLSSISTYEYRTINSNDDLIRAFKSCDIFIKRYSLASPILG